MHVSPLVVPTLLLSAVLALSGALKVPDPAATRDAFASLRLPPRLAASWAPHVLPYGELLLAAALPVVGGPVGVVCAVVVLALFSGYLALIVRALGFDEPVRCACFGPLGLGRVGRLSLARNMVLVLLAVSGVVRASGGDSALAQLGSLDGLEWGWLTMAVTSVVVTVLVLFPGAAPRAEPSSDADYVRHPIPFGQLSQPDGSLKSLRDLARAGAVLLVFLNYGCGPCMRVIEQLPAFDTANPEVSTGAVFPESQGEQVARLALDVPVQLDPRSAVASMFGSGTPSAVLLGADGLIAGGPVTGEHDVLDFLTDIAATLSESRAAVA